MEVFCPAGAQEAEQVVAWAAAEGKPLEVQGGGSKRGLGRPSQAGHRLDLSRLHGIVDYDPSELVLTVRAATTMAEIDEQLAAHRQMLGWEPPDWRGVLGAGGEPTLGGVLACNLSGPRRVRAGAARDHFLGFAGVNGWGDAWKAGGKVVKNVTGYDLCKLQAGAFGTLSVLLEVTVRVLPRPETACTVVLHGLGDDAAVAAMAAALNSPHEVSGAAHLPAAAVARLGMAGLDGPATALRLEGPRPSVRFRADVLGGMLGETLRLDAAETGLFWQAVGAVRPFAGQADALWRVCTAPAAAPALVRQVQTALPGAEAFYDWGGGLVWLAVGNDADCGAATVRAALRTGGGHATLIRAPEAVRAAVPVFEPLAAPLLALSRRVKAGFDPKGILNPGRMMEGV
jgi:glycolate oxidase FAD binding subunit